ncbi:MAG TPA: methyltransferase, partial [Salinarimonas sp.]|nr:methyltransferase [Salinarimonas sp.]
WHRVASWRRGPLGSRQGGKRLTRGVVLRAGLVELASDAHPDDDVAHLLEHEPRAAFDGGPYGIDILRRLVRGSVRALRPGAPLVFEVGAGQDAVATWLLARSGGFEAPAYMRDREGTVRVLVARRQG